MTTYKNVAYAELVKLIGAGEALRVQMEVSRLVAYTLKLGNRKILDARVTSETPISVWATASLSEVRLRIQQPISSANFSVQILWDNGFRADLKWEYANIAIPSIAMLLASSSPNTVFGSAQTVRKLILGLVCAILGADPNTPILPSVNYINSPIWERIESTE